jgi:membrane protease YdiL (CAAX protease family)
MSQNDSLEPNSGHSAEEPSVLKGHDFTGCGNTLSERQEVSGHDLSRAVDGSEKNWALAPEGGFSSSVPNLASETWDPSTSSTSPVQLFQSFSQPAPIPTARIPHFGHLVLLSVFVGIGMLCATALMLIAMHFHLDGVSTQDQITTNVHYLLGFEAILYLVAFIIGFFLFPLFWKKSFFAGIQWRGAVALKLGWRVPVIALGCFLLAVIDELLLPGPTKAPIEELFRSPGAAWLMFGFAITLAPFFEEMAFRGFLLPTLATAWDWATEKSTGKPARPLDANGHPEWSLSAMVAASILTSLPFALLHAEQTGKALGPFLLLVTVSLVLCAVRLKSRSLAASTIVHACYNFLIFFLMLISSGGFRHLDKM